MLLLLVFLGVRMTLPTPFAYHIETAEKLQGLPFIFGMFYLGYIAGKQYG
jgi:hypothetical protein